MNVLKKVLLTAGIVCLAFILSIVPCLAYSGPANDYFFGDLSKTAFTPVGCCYSTTDPTYEYSYIPLNCPVDATNHDVVYWYYNDGYRACEVTTTVTPYEDSSILGLDVSFDDVGWANFYLNPTNVSMNRDFFRETSTPYEFMVYPHESTDYPMGVEITFGFDSVRDGVLYPTIVTMVGSTVIPADSDRNGVIFDLGSYEFEYANWSIPSLDLSYDYNVGIDSFSEFFENYLLVHLINLHFLPLIDSVDFVISHDMPITSTDPVRFITLYKPSDYNTDSITVGNPEDVNVDPFTWFIDLISGLFSIELFGNITLGALLITVLCVPAFLLLLRGIAGG